jgi:dimeric dUTPase (all-alpha-NTP-PPase superfamily)
MKLKQIFKMQAELQKLISKKKGVKTVPLPYDNPLECRNMLFALIVEIGEAAKEDERWKDWKVNPHYDKNKKLEELVDCLFFLISAFLYAGFDVDEVIDAYINKFAINVFRATSEY